MKIDYSDSIFETADGYWLAEYLESPNEQGEIIKCCLSFKLMDSDDSENKSTPERRLRLVMFRSQSAYGDYKRKLDVAIQKWLDSQEDLETLVEMEALYDYPSDLLEPPNNN